MSILLSQEQLPSNLTSLTTDEYAMVPMANEWTNYSDGTAEHLWKSKLVSVGAAIGRIISYPFRPKSAYREVYNPLTYTREYIARRGLRGRLAR